MAGSTGFDPSKGRVMLKLSGWIGTVAAVLALVGCTGPDDVLPPPVPPTPQAVEMSVTLYHCGLNPITYQGMKWEVPDPAPFDNLNYPARWRGHGVVTEVSPTRLLYRDDSGVEVLYLPDAEVPPAGCA